MKKKLPISALFMATIISSCSSYVQMRENAINSRETHEQRLKKSALEDIELYAAETAAYLKKFSQQSAITAAQESVAKSLKDPDSAKFRNVHLVAHGQSFVICGEVNGKNSYGGYVGYTPFVGSPLSATLHSLSINYDALTEAKNASITEACSRTK